MPSSTTFGAIGSNEPRFRLPLWNTTHYPAVDGRLTILNPRFRRTGVHRIAALRLCPLYSSALRFDTYPCQALRGRVRRTRMCTRRMLRRASPLWKRSPGWACSNRYRLPAFLVLRLLALILDFIVAQSRGGCSSGSRGRLSRGAFDDAAPAEERSALAGASAEPLCGIAPNAARQPARASPTS